jgi:hypothetical protein
MLAFSAGEIKRMLLDREVFRKSAYLPADAG